MNHNRETVRQFQQAHADHIESIYSGLAQIPGNPRKVEIRRFGPTRVFWADEDRMENRAIFTGNESKSDFEQVTEFFQKKKRTCFVELNPDNFYRTHPFSWNAEVMPALLALGYRPDAFRCVWHCNRRCEDQHGEDVLALENYASADIVEFIKARLEVLPEDEIRARATAEEIKYGQSTAGWLHYIGLEEGIPVSTSSLFVHNSLGYLKWGFTRTECRNRGHQQAHIRRRIKDAFAQGCTKVFSVTDFDNVSANNLQKCGMTLAYNYVLMIHNRGVS
jgi:hypothetical protein